MVAFLVRRLATIIPTLFFVSMLIFGLQQLLPGDPAMVSPAKNAIRRRRLSARKLHLD